MQHLRAPLHPLPQDEVRLLSQDFAHGGRDGAGRAKRGETAVIGQRGGTPTVPTFLRMLCASASGIFDAFAGARPVCVWRLEREVENLLFSIVASKSLPSSSILKGGRLLVLYFHFLVWPRRPVVVSFSVTRGRSQVCGSGVTHKGAASRACRLAFVAVTAWSLESQRVF